MRVPRGWGEEMERGSEMSAWFLFVYAARAARGRLGLRIDLVGQRPHCAPEEEESGACDNTNKQYVIFRDGGALVDDDGAPPVWAKVMIDFQWSGVVWPRPASDGRCSQLRDAANAHGHGMHEERRRGGDEEHARHAHLACGRHGAVVRALLHGTQQG